MAHTNYTTRALLRRWADRLGHDMVVYLDTPHRVISITARISDVVIVTDKDTFEIPTSDIDLLMWALD
jgi:urease accessory protein UreE